MRTVRSSLSLNLNLNLFRPGEIVQHPAKRPSGIISATRMQVKFSTNRLLKPLCSVVGSILSTEEAHAQIVQICRSGGGSHSVIPGIE